MNEHIQMTDDKLEETSCTTIICPVSIDGHFKTPFNKRLKAIYPQIELKYKKLIKSGLLKLSTTWKVKVWDKNGVWKEVIFISIMKKHDSRAKVKDVEKGLEYLMTKYREYIATNTYIDITSFPTLKGKDKQKLLLLKNGLKEVITDFQIYKG